MQPLRRLSLAEMSAEHLRDGLRAGRWGEVLPGVARLAAELDVSRDTVRSALRLLESDGLLGSGGPGRSRSVIANGAGRHPLRVGILQHDPLEVQNITSHLLLQVQRDLGAKHHEVFFMRKTQVEKLAYSSVNEEIKRVAGDSRQRMVSWVQYSRGVTYFFPAVGQYYFASRRQLTRERM